MGQDKLDVANLPRIIHCLYYGTWQTSSCNISTAFYNFFNDLMKNGASIETSKTRIYQPFV